MSKTIKHAWVLAVLGLALGMAWGADSSLGATTHQFLHYISTASGTNVQPEGVDEEGNIIVLEGDQHTVAKFDINGNPVNFSALGSNEIDGKGGQNCPTVPTDCDRVPTSGFEAGTGNDGNEHYRAVAVDNSGGPANGYIYVANDSAGVACQCTTRGQIDVFDSTGTFRGKIDQSQTAPLAGGNESATIWVDPDGVLYIDHWAFGGGSHVDRYVPIDGNPAHDQFSGQIRIAFGSYEGIAAGRQYAYTVGFDATHGEPFSGYARYPQSEFHRQGVSNFSVSETFPPDQGPFGPDASSWGLNCGCLPVNIYVDPVDEHVYVGERSAGFREFDKENNRIGPTFGDEGCKFGESGCHIEGQIQAITIDHSGDANDGDIYMHGSGANRIAVFGRPVIVPDIEDIEATASHSTAQVNAAISPAGGPSVTSCIFEYSTTVNVFGQYEHAVPCTPATPYSGGTVVTQNLSNLGIEATYHYRFFAYNANGRNYTGDHTFQTHAVLDVSSDPATNVDRTSADLNGSFNPDGMETHYRFEYGISTTYNNRSELLDAGAGTGTQAVAPVNATGLQPGRTYHYRIVAINSLGKTRGSDETFTVPKRPDISGVRATNMTETSAVLNARIDPLSYATQYYFEYGTSPAYGTKTPETALPSASGQQAVEEPITGLEPGVTYHYRVIATNQWGTTTTADSVFSFQAPSCPNSHVRQQTSASYLPDCRAYELVSPGIAGAVTLYPGNVVKAGNTANFNSIAEFLGITAPNYSGRAQSPSRFGFFGAEGAINGLLPPNAILDRYVATRSSTGWVTTYPGLKGNEGVLVEKPMCSETLDKCLDVKTALFGVIPPSHGPFLWNVDGESLGRLPTNLNVIPNGNTFEGDIHPSPDFSQFVFSSRNIAFAPGGLESAPGSVYDNDIGPGTVTLASKTAGGEGIPQDAAGAGGASETIRIQSVSEDGSHILMSTLGPAGTEHLYLRVGDSITYELGEGNFVGATSNGSTIALTSPDRLVPQDTDNSVDMYEWNEQTQEFNLLSLGNGNGNSDSCSATFALNCDVKALKTQRSDLDDAIASQGGDVYFYSPEQLDPENPGVKNERNLYLFHNGQIHYVTTMDPGTQVDRIQISPNGEHMAFLSRTQATGYVNKSLDDGAPKEGDSNKLEAWEEMYTYDPETGEILCASCTPSGLPPAIPTVDTGPRASTTNKDVMASESGRFMSNDGRVAFTTADALAPADTNGKLDVYEFTDNRPQLITSGTSSRDTQGESLFYPTTHTGFEGISQSGTDLYFSTFETLVPEDQNGAFVKFYDARVNGGFPQQPPLLPCTAADECRGDSTSAPGEPSFATAAELGAGGNALAAPKQKRRNARRARRHRRHRSHRGQLRGGGRRG